MRQHSMGWGALLFALFWLMAGTAWAQQKGPEGAAWVQGTPEAAQAQAERNVTQPGNNAPFWRDVRGRDTRGGTVGSTQVRGRETGVLIQSEGQTWREWRNGPLTQIGGWLLAIAFLGAIIFYAIKGTIPTGEPTGRRIPRFSLWERTLHWVTATTFVLLALTGLAMFFGRHVLLPLVGYNAFSWIGQGSKVLHNFLGPLFIVCTLAMFFTFVKDNLWRSYDWDWVRSFGGLFSRTHNEPPSHRFNAGEKAWFWGGLTLLGLIVGISGLVLDFPNFDQSRQTMQWANIVHLIGATLFMAMAIGHIYMGTVGMSGAFRAMVDGDVDETWAREHHYYWYEDIRKGRIDTGTAERPPAPGTTRVEY